MIKGIDVSKYQGVIDWDKVKSSGIEYAIIRCGYGANLEKYDDTMYARNVSECERVGMPYGVYLYSYAKTIDAAKSEAEHVIRLIQGKKFDYPVFYDLEDAKTVGTCNAKTIGDMAEVFVNTIQAAGYQVGIYANKHWFTTILTDPRFNQWQKWVAQYNDKCTYDGSYVMWQYSSKGSVYGIDGNVDMNYSFKNFLNTEAMIHNTTMADKTDDQLADEVIAGKYGAGDNRKLALGDRYDAVQKLVNEKLNPKKPALKSIDEVASEVIAGKWGVGDERRVRLSSAGYDVAQVQAKVNEKLSHKAAAKPVSKPTASKPVNKAVYHKVVKGDTLSGIAKKYGTTYQHLAQLNGITNPNRINIGQKIRIK